MLLRSPGFSEVTMSNLIRSNIYHGLPQLVGSMCAISGVLVMSLPIPIIAGNFEAFHKNQQKMTKAEKGKKKLKAAKIAEFERRQLYCNNKMTSCPSTRSKLPCCVVLTCYDVLARSLLVSRLPAHQPAQGGERQEH